MCGEAQYKRYALLFILFVMPCFMYGRLIESSAPYLSGDTFRSMCDFYFDEVTTSFAPEKVQYGDVVFVKTDMLGAFFNEKHPFIQNPYVIVSHNSDHPAPGPGLPYLDDNKILAWYAQNVEYVHPKLHPIPIGIANKMWAHGNTSTFSRSRQKIGRTPRTTLLYINFSIGTFVNERRRAYELFAQQPYSLTSPMKPLPEYLDDLLKSCFVLSPRGNGLDCHRTWEALYMGAIPIVKESMMDSVFVDLPVLIVKDWQDLDQKILQQTYLKMSSGFYKSEKLYAPYWRSLLTSYKEKKRSHRYKKEVSQRGEK